MTDSTFANDRDRLTDVIDIASEVEAVATASAINETRARARQDQQPDQDGIYAITDCDECGDDIGAGRLAAAPRNLLCIYCATLAERMKR